MSCFGSSLNDFGDIDFENGDSIQLNSAQAVCVEKQLSHGAVGLRQDEAEPYRTKCDMSQVSNPEPSATSLAARKVARTLAKNKQEPDARDGEASFHGARKVRVHPDASVPDELLGTKYARDVSIYSADILVISKLSRLTSVSTKKNEE